MRRSLSVLTSVVKNAVRSTDASGLLHVVGHDDDRVFALDLLHQVLDLRGGDRVQRRARLVHQQHLGLDGDGAGDAQALLLAPDRPSA